MPYIVEEKRSQLDSHIEHLHRELVNLEADDDMNNMEGNINYLITKLLMMVYGDRDSTRYSQINDAIGVLECAKLEFYRVVAAPYENQKQHENGPVVADLEPTITSETSVEFHEHVCGLQGFDPMKDDDCPACDEKG